jgi:dTDP-glucose 4,6-dehydratase
VTAFVHYRSANSGGLLGLLPRDIQQAVRVVPGDLRDHHAIAGAMREQQIVFHLGALIAIPYSYRHPVDVVPTNVDTARRAASARSPAIARP